MPVGIDGVRAGFELRASMSWEHASRPGERGRGSGLMEPSRGWLES